MSLANPLRWGFFGAGKCTHDFVIALTLLPLEFHNAIAVASRDLKKAKQFAKELSLSKYYGSYEELAKDPEIGTEIHSKSKACPLLLINLRI